MSKTFTFFFAPLEAVGHFTASIGIAQQLLKRGHTIAFATPNSWRGRLKPLGFGEEYYQEDDGESTEKWGEIAATMAPALALPTFEKMQHFHIELFKEAVKKAKFSNDKLLQIVQTLNPDVIVVDNVLQIPGLMNQSIPWVFATSLNPLFALDCPELPPGFAGYPIFEANPTHWKNHVEKTQEVYHDIYTDFRSWVIENGGPELKPRITSCWQELSPFANIYMCPQEMAYDTHSKTLKDNKWHRFDSFVRTEEGVFEIPEKLQNLPGKLIYLSMGTIGCCELGLMRKLIQILGKSQNGFIISKGPIGDQLELPDNIWGANHVPQTLVLPIVDLVICHGGNNTVTESFYFGKPVIAMPLFVDQLDNAERVQETGHGLRFEPYHVTEAELLAGIETLLGDELLKKRMYTIGLRMRGSNCQSEAADVIENVAVNNTKITRFSKAAYT